MDSKFHEGYDIGEVVRIKLWSYSQRTSYTDLNPADKRHNQKLKAIREEQKMNYFLTTNYRRTTS